jgi:prevent-host-death family protein
MTEATISHLKNHLPELVHTVEQGEDIQITRHGKPVAVLVSLDKYNQALVSGKGIFNSYLTWRKKHPNATGFTDIELKAMRDITPHETPDFSWDYSLGRCLE